MRRKPSSQRPNAGTDRGGTAPGYSTAELHANLPVCGEHNSDLSQRESHQKMLSNKRLQISAPWNQTVLSYIKKHDEVLLAGQREQDTGQGQELWFICTKTEGLDGGVE